MRIKEKPLYIYKYAKNIAIPRKEKGHITLFQHTVAYSIWAVVLFGIASIVIEAISIENHWFRFIENLFLGIACSGSVVTITAFLQFKSDEADKTNQVCSTLHSLMFAIGIRIKNVDEPIDLSAKKTSLLMNHYKEYSKVDSTLLLYNPKKEIEYAILLKSMIPIVFTLQNVYLELSGMSTSITVKEYYDALDAAEIFFKNYNSICSFEELKKDIDFYYEGRSHDQL